MLESQTFAEFLKNELPLLVNDAKLLKTSDFNYEQISEDFSGAFDTNNVFAYYDEGMVSTSRQRICFTNNAIYIISRFTKLNKIDYTSIGKTYYNEDKKTLKIEINGKDVIDIDWNNFKKDALVEFFDKIVELKNNGLINESDQVHTIEDLSQEARCLYIKILVNLTYEDDRKIDAKELSELHLLMAQIKLTAEMRREIMEYVQLHDKTREELWEELCSLVPNGTEKSLAISLLKDMIRIDRQTSSRESVIFNNYITDFAAANDLGKDFIDSVEKAVQLEIDFISGKISEASYKNGLETIAKSSLSVGIPLTAIWFSGSVTGISAAGITSGLATLGMGGLLGLSSMMSGIGIVVVGGIAIYKGWESLFNIKGDDAPDKRREFFIRKIMEMNQVALRNISNDLGMLGEILVKLTEEVNINREKIEAIQNQFSLYIATMDDRSQGANYAE